MSFNEFTDDFRVHNHLSIDQEAWDQGVHEAVVVDNLKPPLLFDAEPLFSVSASMHFQKDFSMSPSLSVFNAFIAAPTIACESSG